VCVRFGLRVSSERLAVWTGRGDLVSCCATPVVDESRLKITLYHLYFRLDSRVCWSYCFRRKYGFVG
jgi:hypothetical protein